MVRLSITFLMLLFCVCALAQTTLTQFQGTYYGKEATAPSLNIGSPSYTGALSLSYPLFSVAVPGIALNFGMSYNYSGAKAGTTDGDFGLGWNLTGNWTVSRSIKGIADDDDLGILNIDSRTYTTVSNNLPLRNDVINSNDLTVSPRCMLNLLSSLSQTNPNELTLDLVSFQGNKDTEFDIYTLSTSTGSYRFSIYNKSSKVVVNKLDPCPYYIQPIIHEIAFTKIRKIWGFKIALISEVSIEINQPILEFNNMIVSWGISNVKKLDTNEEILISFTYGQKTSSAPLYKYSLVGKREFYMNNGLINKNNYLYTKSIPHSVIKRNFIIGINTKNMTVLFEQYNATSKLIPHYFRNAYQKINITDNYSKQLDCILFNYEFKNVVFRDTSYRVAGGTLIINDQNKSNIPVYLRSIGLKVNNIDKILYSFDYNDCPDLYNISTACDRFGYSNNYSPISISFQEDILDWSRATNSLPTGPLIFPHHEQNSPNKDPNILFASKGCIKQIYDLIAGRKTRFNYEINQVNSNGNNIYSGGLRIASVESEINGQFVPTTTYNYCLSTSSSISSGIYFGKINDDNYSDVYLGTNSGASDFHFIYPFYLHSISDKMSVNQGYSRVAITNYLPTKVTEVYNYNLCSPTYGLITRFATTYPNTSSYRFLNQYLVNKNYDILENDNAFLNGTVQSYEKFDRNDRIVNKTLFEYIVKSNIQENSMELSQLYLSKIFDDGGHLACAYKISPRIIQLDRKTSILYNSYAIPVKTEIETYAYSVNNPGKIIQTEVTSGSKSIKTYYSYLDELGNLPSVGTLYNDIFDQPQLVETKVVLNSSYTLSHTFTKFKVRQISFSLSNPFISPTVFFDRILETKNSMTLSKRLGNVAPSFYTDYAQLLNLSTPSNDYLESSYVTEVDNFNLPKKLIDPINGEQQKFSLGNFYNVLSSTDLSKFGLSYFNTFDQLLVPPTGVIENVDYGATSSLAPGFGGNGNSILFTSQFSPSFSIELTTEQRRNISALEFSVFSKCKNTTDVATGNLVLFLHQGNGANNLISSSLLNLPYTVDGLKWKPIKGRINLKTEDLKSYLLDLTQPIYVSGYLAKDNLTTPCLFDELLVRDLSSGFSSSKSIAEKDLLINTVDNPIREFGTTETTPGIKSIARDHRNRITSKSIFSGQ